MLSDLYSHLHFLLMIAGVCLYNFRILNSDTIRRAHLELGVSLLVYGGSNVPFLPDLCNHALEDKANWLARLNIPVVSVVSYSSFISFPGQTDSVLRF